MSEWKAKRFWKEVSITEADGGFDVLLDARPVKTPAKAPLRLPSRALANAVAAEWAAQDEVIDPNAMPVTRAANSAIDKVAVQFDEVAGLVADYGASDLICYRADEPESLVSAQAMAWDPLVDWAATTLQAPLVITTGIMHVDQPAASIASLRARVMALDPFRLTAVSDLVALSGSLVIGLAVLDGLKPIDDLWEASRTDEIWQASQWGVDEEAQELAEAKRAEFAQAARFLSLCGAAA